MALKDYLQIHTLSIVANGNFNPAIIQPFWLSSKKLIREQDAQNAKVTLIHNELVRMEFEIGLFEITKDRFEIRTSKESDFYPVKDLFESVFQILRETPLTAFGINHVTHYALRDKDSYFKFGNKLAPLDNWKDFLNEPKLLQFEIIDKKRKDGLDGYLRVKVLPSDQIPASDFGVSININDHFNLKEKFGQAKEMVSILDSQWKNSMQMQTDISEGIWKKINEK